MLKNEVVESLKHVGPAFTLLDKEGYGSGDVALRVSEENYRSLMQAIYDGTVFPDPRFIFLTFAYLEGNKFNLVVRIESGFSGFGITAFVAAAEDRPISSVADLWPLAGWHQQELRVLVGMDFLEANGVGKDFSGRKIELSQASPMRRGSK